MMRGEGILNITENRPSSARQRNAIQIWYLFYPYLFENKESPTICYKYNKPIRSTTFNFNKLVTELDIETSTSDSLKCKGI